MLSLCELSYLGIILCPWPPPYVCWDGLNSYYPCGASLGLEGYRLFICYLPRGDISTGIYNCHKLILKSYYTCILSRCGSGAEYWSKRIRDQERYQSNTARLCLKTKRTGIWVCKHTLWIFKLLSKFLQLYDKPGFFFVSFVVVFVFSTRVFSPFPQGSSGRATLD